MSGAPPPATPGAADPSMEDILASIRRILSEDEPAVSTAPEIAPADDVLALDSSMLVEEPPAAPAPAAIALPPPEPPSRPVAEAPPEPPVAPPVARPAPDGLVDAATAAAVTSSVGGLLRTLIAEREQVAVYRGGPTIEELMREEMRPLLKLWLDTNLQPLVERLVRTEIERLVGRALS